MSTDKFAVSRRELLQRASNGFGLVALQGLLANGAFGEPSPSGGTRPDAGGVAGPIVPHFAPRVKNVIFCFMSGGVSHVDTFDPKPRLKTDHGKPMPVPAAQAGNE